MGGGRTRAAARLGGRADPAQCRRHLRLGITGDLCCEERRHNDPGRLHHTHADPVEAGFVSSLGRPNGTFSGLTLMAPVLAGKRLELLKEAAPTARSVAVLVNTANPGMQSTLRHLQAASLTLEVKLQILDARAAHEVEASLARTDSRRASALYVSLDPLFFEHSSAHRGLGGKGAA